MRSFYLILLHYFIFICPIRFNFANSLEIKYHIKKIAVATNFSDEAENAINYAVLLAKKYRAGLDIIHAVSPTESRNKKAQFVSAAYTRLKKYAKGITDEHGVEAKVFARVGEVRDFLYKYCVDHKTDLLIIGVRPHVKKYFTESKACEIIMKIECPVLSIPPHFNNPHFSSVLLPVRDVEGVKEKLVYSRPFIKEDHSELNILCFSQQSTEKGMELVSVAKEQGMKARLLPFEISSKKNVSAEVIDAALENEADLIVINATSEKEWYKIFGENYTEYILKEADIAVLSITHPFESAGV